MPKHNVPINVASFQEPRNIPDKVGENPNPTDPETRTLLISYQYYKDRLCEMAILEKNMARRCLLDFRVVGRSEPQNLYSNGIRVDPVTNAGAYAKLFLGLPPDVKLKEHIISGTGRIFYFTAQNKFHLVAITQKHLETDKHH